jgi:hypothetical protein
MKLTYETYSFPLRLVRIEGDWPRRPIRVTLARSLRAAVVLKACSLVNNPVVNNSRGAYTSSKRLANRGKHFSEGVWVYVCRVGNLKCEINTNIPHNYPVNFGRDTAKCIYICFSFINMLVSIGSPGRVPAKRIVKSSRANPRNNNSLLL